MKVDATVTDGMGLRPKKTLGNPNPTYQRTLSEDTGSDPGPRRDHQRHKAVCPHNMPKSVASLYSKSMSLLVKIHLLPDEHNLFGRGTPKNPHSKKISGYKSTKQSNLTERHGRQYPPHILSRNYKLQYEIAHRQQQTIST